MSTAATVAVVGGCTMGAGIAQVLAERDRSVVVLEATEQAATAAARWVETSMEAAQHRGKLARPVREAMSSIALTTDVNELGQAES